MKLQVILDLIHDTQETMLIAAEYIVTGTKDSLDCLLADDVLSGLDVVNIEAGENETLIIYAEDKNN